MRCVSIKEIAAFGRAMSLQQFDGILCGGFHSLLVSVVAVDEQQHAACFQRNGSADVVAGGRGNSSQAVAINRKVLNVEHTAPDTFVWLSGRS